MDSLTNLSKLIFDLFVANPYAIAIQQPNGKYCTKYVSYDATVIEEMLRSHGSAGCYQQGFRSGKIKWVCLDFDCVNKENPPLDKLLCYLFETFLPRLKALNINYLTEFSGRRGIHVWIIFSESFSKQLGYSILSELLKDVDIDTDLFGLDLFPATDDASKNKVGKQVKFPLSCHTSGGRSFLFQDNCFDPNCVYDVHFYEKQYAILKNYKVNSVEDVCSSLKIDISNDISIINKYKKYSIIGRTSVSADDIIAGLSETKVFSEIFQRLKSGKIYTKDWYVLLGTINSIDCTGNLLKIILSLSPSYNEDTTANYISMLSKKYFPATFGYLYKLFNLSMEPEVNEDETGVDLLSRRYGFYIEEEEKKTNEKDQISLIKTTLRKEQHYQHVNDENVVISIHNDLRMYSDYDCNRLSGIISQIKKNTYEKQINPHFISLLRLEDEEKQRNMVCLCAEDRILTTHIALQMAYVLPNMTENVFSYNVSFLSDKEIFHHWFTSWGNYIEKIRTYIELPYMKDWGIITLDIKHFYDSIDFLSVYEEFKDELDEENISLLRFLVDYNEKLMRTINGNRFGVPQGPAYARILSEAFMNRVLKKCAFFSVPQDEYHMYRYVDDIIIFYKPNVDSNTLYTDFEKLLKNNGLNLNLEKSKKYGRIRDLTDQDKSELLRENKFNYMYKESDVNRMMTEKEKRVLFSKEQLPEFSIEDVAYMFSDRIDETYSRFYYARYADKIFASEFGRGSSFARFYRFVFRREQYLLDAIENKRFDNVPINSLNFKNLVSSLYISVQEKDIDCGLFGELCSTYLKTLSLDSIEDEERTTIESLIMWWQSNE